MIVSALITVAIVLATVIGWALYHFFVLPARSSTQLFPMADASRRFQRKVNRFFTRGAGVDRIPALCELSAHLSEQVSTELFCHEDNYDEAGYAQMVMESVSAHVRNGDVWLALQELNKYDATLTKVANEDQTVRNALRAIRSLSQDLTEALPEFAQPQMTRELADEWIRTRFSSK